MRSTAVNANAYGKNLYHSEKSINSSSMVEHTMITAQESRRRSRSKDLFWIRDLKKKRVGYPSVMHFEGHLASGLEKICDLFAEFIQRTYTDDVWVPSDLGPEHMPDNSPFGTFQFTSDLDVNKGFGPHGIPPIILKNCVSAFAKLLFNRCMATKVFPERWKVSFVSLIFKKDRCNQGQTGHITR
jgi:hypothetical protein